MKEVEVQQQRLCQQKAQCGLSDVCQVSLLSLCLQDAYQSDRRCLGTGKLVQIQGELYFMAGCFDLHPLGIHFQDYIKRG